MKRFFMPNIIVIFITFVSLNISAYAGSCPHGDKVIGRITIDQKGFQYQPGLKRVPFIVWDAMRVGFAAIIYDSSLCMKQEVVIFSNPSIGSHLPLKPVKNLNLKTPLLVTDFYDQYDLKAEEFLADLLHQQNNNMSILVFWDEPDDEALKQGIKDKKIELSYTIFDAQNYTEVPFSIEIELPIVSRKKTIEKLANQFYEQLRTIRENISATQYE